MFSMQEEVVLSDKQEEDENKSLPLQMDSHQKLKNQRATSPEPQLTESPQRQSIDFDQRFLQANNHLNQSKEQEITLF